MKLLKIDNFDEALSGMAQGWRKFDGERFVFEHLSRQSDEFIAGISKFEARMDDVSNYTADILLTNGRKLEYKSWKKNSFSSLMKKDQFKNQLKNYIKDGDFEYIIDRRKLLNDGVIDPDAFVKGEFQKVFKENNYSIYDDLIKEERDIFLKFGIDSKSKYIQEINDLDSSWYKLLKVE